MLQNRESEAGLGDTLRVGYTVTAPSGIAMVSTQGKSPGGYSFGVTDNGLNAFPASGAIAAHTKDTFNAAILGFAQSSSNPIANRNSGVRGIANGLGAGVYGTGGYGPGVFGDGEADGVVGHGKDGSGIYGESTGGNAVAGLINEKGNDAAAVIGSTLGGGAGVRGASASGPGVEAALEDGNISPAVSATTKGSGPAIFATSATGWGVRAFIPNAANDRHAILAETGGTGDGMHSESGAGYAVFGASGENSAIRGLNQNSNNNSPTISASTTGNQANGVFAEVLAPGNQKAAVRGETAGVGAGIEGASKLGRGGSFAGKLAAIRLVPSAAATHPAGGVRGDLFVDNAGRLWYCKAGKAPRWVQLA